MKIQQILWLSEAESSNSEIWLYCIQTSWNLQKLAPVQSTSWPTLHNIFKAFWNSPSPGVQLISYSKVWHEKNMTTKVKNERNQSHQQPEQTASMSPCNSFLNNVLVYLCFPWLQNTSLRFLYSVMASTLKSAFGTSYYCFRYGIFTDQGEKNMWN